MNTKPPKAFIIHASEDKERFVLEFAKKLRANGINAIVDKSEILSGDNVVEKIFDYGLKDADCGIVILSSISVQKPWVNKELQVSVVKQIEEQFKLIPVVIENCTKPESLKDISHIVISDWDDYEKQLNEIIAGILNHKHKTPLGDLPAYADNLLNVIYGLEPIEEKVLKIACDYAVEKEQTIQVPLVKISEVYEDAGFAPDELAEALEILGKEYFLELSQVLGRSKSGIGNISHFKITSYGFRQYLNGYFPNFDKVVRRVVSCIINDELNDNTSIIKKLELKPTIVNFILEELDSLEEIKLTQHSGYNQNIWKVSPTLKRKLAKIDETII